LSSEFFLQLFRAIAVAAGPKLCSVFMPAIAPRVRILYAEQFEILLPVRALFRERRLAEASFHPDRSFGFVYARLAHVVQILIAGNGAVPSEPLLIARMSGRFLPDFSFALTRYRTCRRYHAK